MARGATLTASWLHESQPISNHPVGLGFPHTSGRYRPGGSAFSSAGCLSCGDKEGFLNRGSEITLTGCGGTSALARAATIAARWLHEPQPIGNDPVGLGFPHPAGAFSTRRITVCVPALSELYMYEGIAEPGMGTYPPRARLDRGVFQRGNSRRARLAPSLAEGGGEPSASKVRARKTLG